MTSITRKHLLFRVNLTISLKDLSERIVRDFELGNCISFAPLPVGFEELNALLTTTKGRYIVKIFAKDKDISSIESNVNALLKFYAGGIPVSKLFQTVWGEYLYKIQEDPASYCIVMEYFDGIKFTELTPSTEDFCHVSEILAGIHLLSFQTYANYDIWLTIHLAREFDRKKQYLDEIDKVLIDPVVSGLSAINYSRLTKSIVHFDLHRENVMKDQDNNYCVLDLASCDYNYTIFDIGTFIALFCFDASLSLSTNISLYHEMITSYSLKRKISPYELAILPVVIKATFASNLLISTFLQKTTDPNPEQTRYYRALGKSGLAMFGGISIF